MNIRLDKDVRIRLSHEDVNAWKSNRYLKQNFLFGMMGITVEFKEDASSLESHIQQDKMSELVINLGTEDSYLLCNNMFPSLGISLSSINIEIDKWNTAKRERVEGNKTI